VFGQRAVLFSGEAFRAAIAPWLIRERQEVATGPEFPREGIGCWHPVFLPERMISGYYPQRQSSCWNDFLTKRVPCRFSKSMNRCKSMARLQGWRRRHSTPAVEPLLLRSPDGRFGISIPACVLEGILLLCREAFPKETGGILIGRYNDSLDVALVSSATPPSRFGRWSNLVLSWYARA